jgi:cytochrome P450
MQYPLLPDTQSQVPELLRDLRRHTPITRVTLWNGKQAWLVTRYADAVQALNELSADGTDTNFPSVNPSQPVPNPRGGLAKMHETRHGVVRSMVASKFTARAAERWRPVVEQIVAEQLTVLLSNPTPADLIANFALPVPLRLMCRLVGVPDEQVEYVKRAAQLTITRAYESSEPASRQLRELVAELIRRSERQPSDDLTGELVTERLRTGELTHEELVDLLFVSLVAGHTTTASMIGLSVLSLLEDPDRYRAVREEPGVAATMVDEFLRFHTIATDGLPRVAKRDLVIGGVPIRAGDAVVVSLASANWDEAAFPDPDTLQLRRTEASRHMAFGWGAHRCLGQHLARLELQIALATLARAVPTLRLAVPIDNVRYGQRDRHLVHLQELPVTW